MYDGVSPLGTSVPAWSPAESSCDLCSWWFKSVFPEAIRKGTQWWYIWALPPTVGWDCPLSTLSSKALLHQFITAVIISMFSWRSWVNVLSILNNIHSVIVGHRNCVRWVQCIIILCLNIDNNIIPYSLLWLLCNQLALGGDMWER